jgi:hypothetical protein
VQEAAGHIRSLLAAYNENEDLINAGVYVRGSNDEIDRALTKMPQINQLLRQRIEERSSLRETHSLLCEVAEVPVPEPVAEESAPEEAREYEPASTAESGYEPAQEELSPEELSPEEPPEEEDEA